MTDLLKPDNFVNNTPDQQRELLKKLLKEKIKKPRRVATSCAQRRMWLVNRIEKPNSSYNIPCYITLRGQLDVAVLERSFNEVIKRHTSLRTTFEELDGEPVQVIAPHNEVKLPICDLTATAEPNLKKQLEYYLSNESELLFDLAKGPLIRSKLFKISEQKYVLLLVMHHIVSDGWSVGILFSELFKIYQLYQHVNDAVLPALQLQYADYSARQLHWLEGEEYCNQLDYWKKQLADLPVLELPTDRPRPAVKVNKGEIHELVLDKTLSKQLNQLCEQEGITLYMLLSTAFSVLLYRYSNQSDVVFGTPVANRNQADIEHLIGFFVNMLVIRIDLSGNPSFRELLDRNKKSALRSYKNQDIPFEKLVDEIRPERDLSRNPLFQVVLALQNEPIPDINIEGLDISRPVVPGYDISEYELSNVMTRFDVELHIWEGINGIRGNWIFDVALFEAETIKHMSQHLIQILRQMIKSPEQCIASFSLLTEIEHNEIAGWNQTATDYPRTQTVHELFEQQVSETPDAIAVEYEGNTVSYAQLNKRANQLAHYLQARGVGPEVMVGICVERSLEMVVGLLGILKAGGAYVPLDPDYPKPRLAFMLEDAQVPVLLTLSSLQGGLPDFAGEIISLDTDWPDIEQASADNPVAEAKADNLAYMIYTSGSTGQPKGVAVPHRAINRLVCNTDYFQVEPADRVAQASNMSFDAATFELWGALLNGATLVGVNKDVLLNPQNLSTLLSEQGITTLFMTTALFNLMAREAPTAFSGLRGVMFGGEAVDPKSVRRVMISGPPEHLLHVYGPTESTTFASWYRVDDVAEDATTVPIGKPIANTRLYILDSDMNPVPVGVPGELYIGGDGLARGYLGHPELTAQRFVVDPFSNEVGARLYRTGDRVRYHRDGAIEFLGRFDHQVKVRGFRIELGEIESVLVDLVTVQDAVVVVHEDELGDKRLVAYVVPEESSPVVMAELRNFMRKRLPDYMVPSAFMVLDSLPLTTNGKVDRRALPVLDGEQQSEADYIEPRSKLERQLADIWRDVLMVDQIGIHDNFFDLGGHSLKATQVVSRLRGALGVELPLSEMFGCPTVAELTPIIETLMNESAESEQEVIVPLARDGEFPLSFAQERLWFLDQLEHGNVAYNIPLAISLKGELSVAALQRSLNAIVHRHEALRTRFVNRQRGPVQIIEQEVRFDLLQIDLSDLPSGARDQEMMQRLQAEEIRSFDLANGPLLRGTLLRLSEHEHVLLLTMHHIISDGWSLGILFKELGDYYAAFSTGREPVPTELTIQYVDFAVWQRQLSGQKLKLELDFWKQQLAGLPTLDLPTDRPRPPMQTYKGSQEKLLLDGQLKQQLESLSKQSGVTFFTTMLGVYMMMLHRYSSQDDVVIGSPIANRNRSELEGLIAFFTNMLVIRVDTSGNPSFKEFVKRVSATALAAYEHQDIPFEKLVEVLQIERDPSRNPLFQVHFAMQDALLAPLELHGLTLEPVSSEAQVTRFDLECYVWVQEDGLEIVFLYNEDLFDAATIRRMLAHYCTLLKSVNAEPDRPIDLLPMLSRDEKHLILEQWNQTAKTYPLDKTLHELFEAQVKLTPQAIAIEHNDQTLSYHELDERANRLAHYLQDNGIGPGKLAGVFMERSLEMVIALYGILKAGGAYVPLDPEYPHERIAFMVVETQVPVLITQQHLRDQLPHTKANIVCLDSQWDAIANISSTRLSSQSTPDDLAYVIYTSGSTGKPKGVMNCHKAIVNRLLWMQETYQLQAEDRVLQKTPFSFDVSVWEFFWPLITGARLVIADPGGHKDPEYLSRLINEKQITTLHFVPSMLKAYLDHTNLGAATHIKRVICSGEALSYDLQEQFFRTSSAELHNLYGPTEAAVDVTSWACRRGDERQVVPIGRPIANTRLYILDPQMQAVPVGVSGELHIGGVQVARGYLERPELTKEKFIADPFSDDPAARLYKTGDLVRYLPDGDIEYLGRMDNQVKLRGFRIELGEIESLLCQHSAVREAVVLCREDEAQGQRLVAYVIAGGPEAPSMVDLRAYVRQKLPDYMVPSVFMVLDRFPLTANGKLDQRALPMPDGERQSGETFVEPRSDLERQLAEIWRQVLGVAQVGIHDNFFDLGGHSLMLVELHNRLNDQIDAPISVVDLFAHPTVSALVEHIVQSEIAVGARSEEYNRVADMAAGKQRLQQLLQSRQRNLGNSD